MLRRGRTAGARFDLHDRPAAPYLRRGLALVDHHPRRREHPGRCHGARAVDASQAHHHRALPVPHEDAPQGVRGGEGTATDRAAEDAGMGAPGGRADRHDLRGARRRGEGRHDQAARGAPEPAVRSSRRPREAQRSRTGPVVLPAVSPPSAHEGRDRVLRPLLVQPRGCRAGDGFLHIRRVHGVHAAGPRPRADARAVRAFACSSSGSR